MDNLFDKLGLNPSLAEGLKKAGITNPTEIQEKAVPLALKDIDIIGESETGTGKTLAYLLPIFHKIDVNVKGAQAIILAPTHELVMQIHNEIKKLANNSNLPIKSTSIIGNVNIKRQIENLKEKPHIIVGSAGRILELIKMKKIKAHTVKTIVIDEADKLLHFQHIEEVNSVIKCTLKDRQLMLFSASMSSDTITIGEKFMNNPEIVKIESKTMVNPNIEHMHLTTEKRDKIMVLRKLVASIKPKKAIVFINKTEEIETLTAKLKYHGLKAESIHGASIKADRKKAMEDFKTGKINLLISSDIAARGIDIKGVTHIFNFDIPENPKDYLHRVGRTGRAGQKGIALSITTESELPLIKSFEKSFNITITPKDLYYGKIIDIDEKPTKFKNTKKLKQNTHTKSKNNSHRKPTSKNSKNKRKK